MPNGGFHHCGHCQHFQGDTWYCTLRDLVIEDPGWTTCNNFLADDPIAVPHWKTYYTDDHPSDAVDGPVYAIVCEVRNRSGRYGEIPYFDGVRVDTEQKSRGGDTFIRFTDPRGTTYLFASVADYLEFYEASGRSF